MLKRILQFFLIWTVTSLIIFVFIEMLEGGIYFGAPKIINFNFNEHVSGVFVLSDMLAFLLSIFIFYAYTSHQREKREDIEILRKYNQRAKCKNVRPVKNIQQGKNIQNEDYSFWIEDDEE